jgi:hypothetical protein
MLSTTASMMSRAGRRGAAAADPGRGSVAASVRVLLGCEVDSCTVSL